MTECQLLHITFVPLPRDFQLYTRALLLGSLWGRCVVWGQCPWALGPGAAGGRKQLPAGSLQRFGVHAAPAGSFQGVELESRCSVVLLSACLPRMEPSVSRVPRPTPESSLLKGKHSSDCADVGFVRVTVWLLQHQPREPSREVCEVSHERRAAQSRVPLLHSCEASLFNLAGTFFPKKASLQSQITLHPSGSPCGTCSLALSLFQP